MITILLTKDCENLEWKALLRPVWVMTSQKSITWGRAERGCILPVSQEGEELHHIHP